MKTAADQQTELDHSWGLVSAALAHPAPEAWQATQEIRAAADAAWLASRERWGARGPILDRQLLCFIVEGALERRALEEVPRESRLPWRECLARAPMTAGEIPNPALCQAARALSDCAVADVDPLLDALLAQDDSGALREAATTLAARGLLAHAERALHGISFVFDFERTSRALAPMLGDEARRAAAESLWRRADQARELDLYGPGWVTSLWGAAVLLWPAGDPEALRRLLWLDGHLASFVSDAERDAGQGGPDLHVLMAHAWVHHGDPDRAVAWYMRLGRSRHHWCGHLAPLLPEHHRRAMYTAATLDMIEKVKARGSSLEQDLAYLQSAPAEVAEDAEDRASRVLTDLPLDLLRIGLIPRLSAERARAIWRQQLQEIAEPVGEAMDDRLEALLLVAVHVEDALSEVLPWVLRWPRPEPLQVLSAVWPAETLAEPLRAWLARTDVSPDDAAWRSLVVKIVGAHPALRGLLPPAWIATLPAPRRPPPPDIRPTPEGLEWLLRPLAPADQEEGVRIYAEEVTGWGVPAQAAVLARLRAPAERITAPEPDHAWRGWARTALHERDLETLRATFPLFSAHKDTLWLTLRLVDDPEGFGVWLAALRESGETMLWMSLMVAVLEAAPAAEVRSVALAALEEAAAVILHGSRGPDLHSFDQWGGALQYLSAETLALLWEQRMMPTGSQHREGTQAVVMLAMQIGGIARLRAALRAQVALYQRPLAEKCW